MMMGIMRYIMDEEAMALPVTVSPFSSVTIPTKELAVISVKAMMTYTSAIQTKIIKGTMLCWKRLSG